MLLVGAFLLAIFVLPSPWGVVLVAVAGLVEIAETAFWFRFSRRRRARVGVETMIGSTAVVAEPCRPVGQVRLEGELWQARCEAGADRGDRVRVVGRHRLTLVVEPFAAGK